MLYGFFFSLGLHYAYYHTCVHSEQWKTEWEIRCMRYLKDGVQVFNLECNVFGGIAVFRDMFSYLCDSTITSQRMIRNNAEIYLFRQMMVWNLMLNSDQYFFSGVTRSYADVGLPQKWPFGMVGGWSRTFSRSDGLFLAQPTALKHWRADWYIEKYNELEHPRRLITSRAPLYNHFRTCQPFWP